MCVSITDHKVDQPDAVFVSHPPSEKPDDTEVD
jgi:hypothetical protein